MKNIYPWNWCIIRLRKKGSDDSHFIAIDNESGFDIVGPITGISGIGSDSTDIIVNDVNYSCLRSMYGISEASKIGMLNAKVRELGIMYNSKPSVLSLTQVNIISGLDKYLELA